MLDERQIMLKHVELVASQLLASTKSRTLTLKLRTLVRYAYTSYVKGTLDFPTIRGSAHRYKPPNWMVSQLFYRQAERALAKRLNAKVVRRRGQVYVVLEKREEKKALIAEA